MQTPFVSVVIPNYCHARYLDQRIQSVMNQTYQNFEVIILDDCSLDDGASRAVIEGYRNNSHVSHIIYNEKNSGSTFKQWDKGFELATGEFIWIAESDDSCEPTLLEELVTRLSANPQASVAFCRSIAFDDSETLGPVGPHSIQEGIIKGVEFIHDYMRSGCGIVNASSAIFRRCFVSKIRNEFKTFKGSGDRLFWIEMAEQGDIIFINKPLNYFRMHVGNSTKKSSIMGINQREDKYILDYIYSKGYINRREYVLCKDMYVKVHIFQMLKDKKLKKELYKLWEYNKMKQLSLKIEAWYNHLISFF